MYKLAVIEMPMNTRYKYEVHPFYSHLILDRVLNAYIPHNYGYLDNTKAPDGDAEDVFVLTVDPLIPLSKVRVKIIGKFICEDNGVSDDKWLGTLSDFTQIDAAKAQIKAYLEVYKPGFIVKGWLSYE